MFNSHSSQLQPTPIDTHFGPRQHREIPIHGFTALQCPTPARMYWPRLACQPTRSARFSPPGLTPARTAE